jgi:asparagine synthase (glutamine-hydrolysing)
VNYLRLLYVPAPQTIYKNIRKLPPGHLLHLRNSQLDVKKYWRIEPSIAQAGIFQDDAAGRLRELLEEAVGIRLISEVPLGAFLSGGVDSSTVVALMSQMSNRSVMSHGVSFREKEYDESAFAREIADRFSCDHQEITVIPDVRQILKKLIWHMDEPFADSSIIPTYYICQAARQRVTVCLSGDGGDELFAGYN